MPDVQSEVRALFERRSEAIRDKDIDLLMSTYAPDILYFDLVPPLQYAGSVALRARFVEWFGGWESSIGQEIRDLSVVASGDVAAASMLIRASGSRKNGQEVGYWVRATDCCRQTDHRWSIVHEHISLPVDMQTGRAAMELEP